MKIKLCDIYKADEPYRLYIDDAIMTTVAESKFILGEKVAKFEENFANYIGTKHCIGVSSCTAALHLALETLEIKGKVLVPAMTVTADAEAVLHAGCTPVFYDNDFEGIEEVVKGCKAIIVVHLYGNPVDMDSVMKFAKTHNLFVIEDCAQSTGATWKGRKTGTFGDVSCFSFFPTKPLGCYGDGGALLTNNDLIAGKVRALRNHGRLPGEKTTHTYVGYNYRLDGLQAAVLDVKLRFLDECIEKRREVAKKYDDRMEWNEDIWHPDYFKESAYYLYTVFVNRRNELKKFLKQKGLGTGRHYPVPLHKQPPFKECEAQKEMPYADNIAKHELSLPMYPGLKDEQIEYVCQRIERFYENTARN